MELKIDSKTEQPLLSRTEMKATIAFENVTPSRQEVRKKLAESLKAKEELVLVENISTDFGARSAKVTVHIYETKEAMGMYAGATVLQRHSPKEEKKAEAAG